VLLLRRRDVAGTNGTLNSTTRFQVSAFAACIFAGCAMLRQESAWVDRFLRTGFTSPKVVNIL
jgi:hypothetical protein